MILADKIIEERKKNGWSQEELAEKLETSRQSVSKWEGAQSVPDLQKIIKMSELFGVTTDYLLKDEISEIQYDEKSDDSSTAVRLISMEQANSFLELNRKTAGKTALGVALCILSPVCLFILGNISEEIGLGIGMVVLLLFVSIAVGIFISSGRAMEEYGFLEEQYIETAYGVSGMVKERKKNYRDSHTRDLIIGAVLCIMAAAVLFGAPDAVDNNDVLAAVLISAMLALIALGVFILVRTGSIQDGFDMLLEEGDFTRERKSDKTTRKAVSSAYWLTAVALFLVISFVTGSWHVSWIVFAAAGVLFPAVRAIYRAVRSGKKK